ncbi:MAG: hypothetical protein JXB08_06715 [Bacilli bacterium]|nr:hypothetical protein [Bacilli bacterium]MBN2877763.1 hypothetical protein [Bacilli bacterium]
MSIKSFFSPSCETREMHVDPALRTHYYRNNFKQVVEGLTKLAEKNNMAVKDINEIHKEIYLIGNGFDCIVTVSQISPIEAGIDFKINFFSAVGFGRPVKKALKLFKDLAEILNFKGIALHP